MRVASTMLGLALSLCACAERAQEVNLRTVLDEAQKNELGPTTQLRSEKIAISGVVERTGLKKQKEWSHTAVQGLGTLSFDSERVQRHYPYVVVAPEDQKPGRALCFFEMADADEIVKLVLGETVRFEGELQEFLKQDGQEVMVMQCKIPK